MTDLDAYAADLLHRTVRPLAAIARNYGPDTLIARWRELPASEQEAAVAMLAAGFPLTASDDDVYSWLNTPAVKPLHADEYWESPRPLVVSLLTDERFIPTGRRAA